MLPAMELEVQILVDIEKEIENAFKQSASRPLNEYAMMLLSCYSKYVNFSSLNTEYPIFCHALHREEQSFFVPLTHYMIFIQNSVVFCRDSLLANSVIA